MRPTSRQFLTMLMMALCLAMLPARSIAAQDASPMPQGPDASSPLDQLNALLASPFPTESLPAGFSNPVISQWNDTSDRDLVGTIGGVRIVLNSDEATGIYYLIYPTQTVAESYFQANLQSGGTTIPTIQATSDFGTRIQLNYDTGSVCVEQLSNVVVIGGVGS